jgi:hypothetical protein
LRFNLKNLSKSNHLPEYNLSIDGDDVILISRKTPHKESLPPQQLPQHVNKKELEKQARPGESYEQVKNRLSNKGNIKKLKQATIGNK